MGPCSSFAQCHFPSHLWAQLFGVELRPEVQPPIDGFHLWTSLFRGWTHAHSNQYGIWRQLASINLLSTKQTVGIQTETEPISGSFTLREPKRTQTNQRLTVFNVSQQNETKKHVGICNPTGNKHPLPRLNHDGRTASPFAFPEVAGGIVGGKWTHRKWQVEGIV